MSRLILTLFLCFIVAVPSSASRKKTKTEDVYVLKVRGVMEHFPDVADGFESRLASYAASGVTHYFYCPSDDRYSNRWGWKFLYNDSDRKDLRGYRSLCQKYGVEFVWTINPSDGFTWSREDYDFLLNKLIIMYYNGIRSFAVWLPEDDRQAGVKELLHRDFAASMKERVTLFMVNDMAVVDYPSESDVARTLMKGYHFDDDFKARALGTRGILCRMTVDDGFGGIPVAAAVDYARNPDGYKADRSIAEGIDAMTNDVKSAFLTFLSHTGGDDESSQVKTFSLDTWSEDAAVALYREFDRISEVPARLETAAGTAVMEALAPWLVEFGRLGIRGKKAIDCVGYYKTDDIGKFWLSYVESVMTEEERLSYRCCPVGSSKLQPFCENVMSEMIAAFAARLTDGAAQRNLASTLYQAPNEALDSDFHTFAPSSGHIVFPVPADANTCRLLTGPLPEDKVVLFRELGTDGSLMAEFVVDSPYSEFDLKEGTVKVDVLGDIDIYESIFVYL